MLRTIALLTAACLACGLIAPAQANDIYVEESGLDAHIKRVKPIFKYSWRHWRPHKKLAGLKLTVAVKNRTHYTVNRPYRLVVKTHNKVLNADGYTDSGRPFIWICETACDLEQRGRDWAHVQIAPGKRGLRGVRFDVEYQPYTIQLLHFADIDGIGPLANVRNFSGLVDSLRATMPNKTLLLSSGDNWIPGPTYAAGNDDSLAALVGIPGSGRGDLQILNEMGVQASAVGNHELDEAPGVFAGIIGPEADTAGATYAGAQFPYLSANIDFGPSAAGALVTADAQDGVANSIARSAIVHVDGEPIGVVGASSPTFVNITSTGDALVTPTLLSDGSIDTPALAAEIQAAVDALTSIGIDKIVVLAHMQVLDVERELAPLLQDVDIVIGGGSNTILADENDLLREDDVASGTYPELYSAVDGAPVALVNTDGDYKYLGRMITAFDLSGQIITSALNSEANGAYATDDTSLITTQGSVPTANANVAAIADALNAVLVASEGNFFGFTDVYLDGRRSTVRTEEANMGNLTADANLYAAQQVDPSVVVSFKNGGGIRADIGDIVFPPGSSDPADIQFLPPAEIPGVKPAGAISEFDIQTTLRFNNGLSLITATAEELRAVIEHAVSFDVVGETEAGQFPQVSGIRFSFDPNGTPNNRIVDLTIVDENSGTVIDTIVANGVTVGTGNYRMVALDFLVGGGDGFPFPSFSAPNRVDLKQADDAPRTGAATFAVDGSEQDALAEYVTVNFATPETAYDAPETPRAEDQRIVFLP